MHATSRKNGEANTLAMLFEAHRSLLIDIFLSQQKLPKMLIMAHMCTSLSIMRPKLYTDPKQNNHKLEFLLLYKQSFFFCAGQIQLCPLDCYYQVNK